MINLQTYSIRKILKSLAIVLAAILLSLLCFVGVKFFFSNHAIRIINLAAAPYNSDWSDYAEIIKANLMPHHIDLKIFYTDGSIQNIEDLSKHHKTNINAAFVYDSLVSDKEKGEMLSLGSYGYEPIWIFYRESAFSNKPTIRDLAQKRVAINAVRSGSYWMTQTLFEDKGINIEKDSHFTTYNNIGEQINAYQNNQADVVIFICSYSYKGVREALLMPGIKLLNLNDARQYADIYKLTEIILPAGSVNAEQSVPDIDIHMIASPVTLAVSNDMDSDLQLGLLIAASSAIKIKSPFMFKGSRMEFPSYDWGVANVPLSPIAKKYYLSGEPFLTKIFPQWLKYTIFE
jgi:TRAP-type uncharacterized transport system substrate-binding protein